MNTTQWERFFEKEEHTLKQLARASDDASNFYACAAGCKLQDIYSKSEKELECIPYDVLYSALSTKAYYLAHQFHKEIDGGKGGEPTAKAKQIFRQLQGMYKDDFLSR